MHRTFETRARSPQRGVLWRGWFAPLFLALAIFFPSQAALAAHTPISVTATGKDAATADLNARVAAVRQALHRAAAPEALLAEAERIRKTFILNSGAYTSEVRVSSVEKEKGLIRITATVLVDEEKILAALRGIAPEAVALAPAPVTPQPGEKNTPGPVAAAPVADKASAPAQALMSLIDFVSQRDPKDQDPELLRQILAAKADPNVRNDSDNPALNILLESAGSGVNPENMRLLLAAGANVNGASRFGTTALMTAATKGSPEAVTLLLQSGADIEAKDVDGRTALMLLLEAKYLQKHTPETYKAMLQALLAGKPKPDQAGHGALVLALKNPQMPLTELWGMLLKAGADVNAADKDGETALFKLCGPEKEDRKAEARFLIQAGANVNAADPGGRTTLMQAVFWSSPEMVSLLLGSGADTEARDEKGLTVLEQLAAHDSGSPDTREAFTAVLQVLLAASPDCNPPGAPLLLRAVTNKRVPLLELWDTLLKAGADVNAADKDGRTALMWACSFENKSGQALEQARFLIKAGADVNRAAKNGETALFGARGPELIRLLLESGADAKARNANGLSVLVETLRRNPSAQEVELLLGAGADINDKSGDTPAFWFPFSHSDTELEPLRRAVLQAKPDLDARDGKGLTALMVAYEETHGDGTARLKRLLDAGFDINARDKDGNTLLRRALNYYRFNPGGVAFILDAGPDLTIKGGDGLTAYDYFLENKDKYSDQETHEKLLSRLAP